MLILMYFLVFLFCYFKTFSVDLRTCVTVFLCLSTSVNWCNKSMCMYCMCLCVCVSARVCVCRPLRYQWTIITLRIFSREHQLCLCSGSWDRGGSAVLQLHKWNRTPTPTPTSPQLPSSRTSLKSYEEREREVWDRRAAQVFVWKG